VVDHPGYFQEGQWDPQTSACCSMDAALWGIGRIVGSACNWALQALSPLPRALVEALVTLNSLPIFRSDWKCNCHDQYQSKQQAQDGTLHAGRVARPSGCAADGTLEEVRGRTGPLAENRARHRKSVFETSFSSILGGEYST